MAPESSRSAFVRAQAQAEADGREIVATLRGSISVEAFVMMIDGLGLAYGAEVRVQQSDPWWFFTAPKGWESAEPLRPHAERELT